MPLIVEQSRPCFVSLDRYNRIPCITRKSTNITPYSYPYHLIALDNKQRHQFPSLVYGLPSFAYCPRNYHGLQYLDVSVRTLLCSCHRCHHGCLCLVHRSDNCLEDKIQEAGQRRRQPSRDRCRGIPHQL